MENDIPIRKMRALAIEIAIDEMRTISSDACAIFRRREHRKRLHALLWLGSKEGGRWFRAIEADHIEALHAIEWARHTAAILESGTPINQAQRTNLETGLAALEATPPTPGYRPAGLQEFPEADYAT